MKARDRQRKLERAQQHQSFCRARNRERAEQEPPSSVPFGKPPMDPRGLRRRLARAGRSQWRGRPFKKGTVK